MGLAVAAAALVAAATCVLVLGARRPAEEAARSEAFQRLVGGLGGGSAISLAPCERGFDPGLSGSCSLETAYGHGNGACCPHHSGPSLRR